MPVAGNRFLGKYKQVHKPENLSFAICMKGTAKVMVGSQSYKCRNTLVISALRACDGVNDCLNASDENCLKESDCLLPSNKNLMRCVFLSEQGVLLQSTFNKLIHCFAKAATQYRDTGSIWTCQKLLLMSLICKKKQWLMFCQDHQQNSWFPWL